MPMLSVEEFQSNLTVFGEIESALRLIGTDGTILSSAFTII